MDPLPNAAPSPTRAHDSPSNLAGRVALVTGSTSGIGLAIAHAFAAAGAHVVMNGRGDPAEVESLRAEVQAAANHGGRVIYRRADMGAPADVAALVAATTETFGRLDVLVANAGIQHVAPVDEFPPDRWDAIIATNLTAVFHATRAVVPGMKTQGFGRIIAIASAHALVASPYKSAYVAAKHGVLGFVKSVALEVAQAGITVNAICPGYVLTPLVEKQIPDTARARGMTHEQVVRDVLLAAQPTRRFVMAEEIGALAVFLSGPAGASITGAALPVDGGWTAQ